MTENHLYIMGGLVVLAGATFAMYLATSVPTLVDDEPADPITDDDNTQETSYFEDAVVAVSPSTYYTPGVNVIAMEKNLSAFLDMIAYSEGTAMPEGYRAMFGYPRIPGRLCQSLADHPRQYFSFTDKTGKTNKTSAAGRYQFLARTWDDLRAKLSLSDFSEASQDAAAIELIRQRGALNDVKAGRIESAIAKCSPIWASLPGAGYNQPERKLSSLLTAFNNSGGVTV